MTGQTWVFLDPDGTGEDWSYVVVRADTGVTYEQQCGGGECLLRTVQGYLVPVYQHEVLTELGDLLANEVDTSAAEPVSAEVRKQVAELVGEIRFWPSVRDGGDAVALALDEDRIGELTEAWVPVTTPDGPGVLIWPNSD